jgi:hypothetical protein
MALDRGESIGNHASRLCGYQGERGDQMTERFLEVSQAAGAALFAQNISGEVVMLNLLRFRDVADYSANPELMPSHPISGAEAYQKGDREGRSLKSK